MKAIVVQGEGDNPFLVWEDVDDILDPVGGSYLQRNVQALASGELKSIIDSTVPIKEVQRAHAYVGANKNTGKVILLL